MRIKNMRIKNTRANKIYLIIGRLFVYAGMYAISVMATIKFLEFVVCNCITTIK